MSIPPQIQGGVGLSMTEEQDGVQKSLCLILDLMCLADPGKARDCSTNSFVIDWIDVYGNTAKYGQSEIIRIELRFFKLKFCFYDLENV